MGAVPVTRNSCQEPVEGHGLEQRRQGEALYILFSTLLYFFRIIFLQPLHEHNYLSKVLESSWQKFVSRKNVTEEKVIWLLRVGIFMEQISKR